MRVLVLSPLMTFIIDVLAWLIIHLGGSYLCYKIPYHVFEINGPMSGYRWEKGGSIYEQVFGIKKWKGRLPDGSLLFQKGFAKKHLADTTFDYFMRFAAETRRAECTHWLCFLAAFLFFLWNDFMTGIIMVLYGIVANFPCIIAQRYNRLRLLKISQKKRVIHSQEGRDKQDENA